MINLTTDEMEYFGGMIIDIIAHEEAFDKFNVAEMVALFSSAIYILGREVGEKDVGVYTQIDDDMDMAA
jgi:hypothetical protein